MTVATLVREFVEVDLALVDDPELPSRTAMDDDKLDQLVESIRTIGLQEPLILFRDGHRFQVIAGHRRLIACTRAGLGTVPAIVYPTKDIPRRIIQAHENTKREDLNPADEAIWFMELLEQECGGDIERLCGLVGESLSYVDGRLALMRGCEMVFDALRHGQITIAAARELNTCPDAHYRKYFLDCAIKSGATRATIVAWIQDWKQSQLPATATPASGAAEPAGMASEIASPFICVICGKNNNVHLIRQVSIHQHCQMAILDPLLANARGEA